jgi:hypothetical protein
VASITETAEAAERALARLEELGDAEGQRMYDGDLNWHLEPLRGAPALPVHCPSCHRRIAWWAVMPTMALVAATRSRARPKSRHGGHSDLDADIPDEKKGRFFEWIVLADEGGTGVTSTDIRNSDYPRRLTFECKRCGAKQPTTNSYRLRKLLQTFKVGGGRIVL